MCNNVMKDDHTRLPRLILRLSTRSLSDGHVLGTDGRLLKWGWRVPAVRIWRMEAAVDRQARAPAPRSRMHWRPKQCRSVPSAKSREGTKEKEDIQIGQLIKVQTFDFGFLRCPQRTYTWDSIQDWKNDPGSEKTIRNDGWRASELVSELDPVMIDPSTRNSRPAIRGSNVGVGKDAGQEWADQATHSMGSKDIYA